MAGIFEIGGGWLVWGSLRYVQQMHHLMQGVHRPDLARPLRRDKRPFWWGIIGGLVLAAYGVVATYQPPGLDFGRVYAAYGLVCCTCACPPARRRLYATAVDCSLRGLW